MENMFENLYELNVNDKVEQKNGLNYLSWAYAWAEIKKIYPKATYKIYKFGEKNVPYVYDENTGYMVFTSVTIEGITHEMWLPVMDNANKAMLIRPYTYQVKEYVNGKFTGNYTGKRVEPATMFDVNKTIMRCLTKNLAMFGLGLSLYQGEDLPAVVTKEDAENLKLSFGKYQGKTLGEIFESDRSYFEWLRGNAKDENVKVAIDLIDKEPVSHEAGINNSPINEGQKQWIKSEVDEDTIRDYLTKFGKHKLSELTFGEAEKIRTERE